jgi:hypothetical protein
MFTEIPIRGATSIGSAQGVHLGGMFHLGRDWHVGPILALEHATHPIDNRPITGLTSGAPTTVRIYTLSVPDSIDTTMARAGARLGWGAPWGARTLGAYADLALGDMWWHVNDGSYTAHATYILLSPTFVAQWPTGEVRPFVSVGLDAVLGGLSEAGKPPFSFGMHAGAGVAWSAL